MRKPILLAMVLSLTAGCAAIEQMGDLNVYGVNVGKIASSTAKAARPISDEEEYYVGRAVAAKILSQYQIYKDLNLHRYVNLVGQTVALQSDKPSTFGGYHFAVLDSREINAFACPGGTIFITRGMLATLKSEDELAGVLAHEITHVNNRDGISAIKSARWTEAVTVIGTEAARQYSRGELSQLVNLFEGSIDDVFKTLVVNGYSRSQEKAADQGGVAFMARAGYDPSAMKSYLERLSRQGAGAEGGMFKTHPATADRIEAVNSAMPSTNQNPAYVAYRANRFRDSVR